MKPVESARFIPFFNNEDDTNDESGELNQKVIEEAKPTLPDNIVNNQEINPIPGVEEVKPYTDNLINEFRQNNPQTVEVNGATPNNLRVAINSVREMTENLKKSGYAIDSEEFDFENLYQIIIKINK